MSSKDWDAGTYARVSTGVQAVWAQKVLDRLELQPGEAVLDAGCGSGGVTAQLADRVGPHGRVYGVDVAPSMVEHAREALGDRATIWQQDLLELTVPEPVDAVFSNATFHWVLDHERLFAQLFGALKPGGRLVAQCGGKGNIARFRADAQAVASEPAYAPYFENAPEHWLYADAEETAERLTKAGFTDVETWLEPMLTPMDDPKPFITTVNLVRALEALPEALREPYVDAVIERSPTPFELDYVRLNMVARRPVIA
jgi:trans-aconitate 2-methyltransferase